MREPVQIDQWCMNISDSINSAVLENWPRPWEENDVTTSILRTLCTKNQDVRVRSIKDHPMFTVEWDAFKLKGKLETDRGDVAVLVRFHSTEPEPLEGVGYFEAKKVYNNGQFKGIETWDQLEHMRRNVAHHHLVLYDNEGCSWNRYRPGPSKWGFSPSHTVNCLAIPTNRATALRKKNRDLYAHCTSFWELLCLRYIQGFDLEFERYFVDEATGFINRRGGPSFLLVANVTVSDGDQPMEGPRHTETQVSDAYRRIAEHDDNHHRDEPR